MSGKPTATTSAATSAVIGLLAIVVYGNALNNGYTFDDQWVIQDNPIVQVYSVPDIFRSTYSPGPVYRPLTLVTFAVTERLGINPFADHAINVLLHAIVSCLVYLLGLRVLANRTGATIAALVFAVHPIHTEAVASLVGRAELLSTVFALTILLSFHRFLHLQNGHVGWLALAMVLYGIAPFAKENALTLLPLLVGWHWYVRREATWTQHAAVAGGFVAAASFYLLLRIYFTGALTYPNAFPPLDNPLAHVPANVRITTAMAVLFQYVSLLVAPIRLSADYSFNQIPLATSPLDPRVLVTLLGTAAVCGALWFYRRHTQVLLLCAAFCVCTMSLTSNLPFAIGTVMGERLLYLPSVGWCIALGSIAAWAMQSHRRTTLGVVALVLVLFAVRTLDRNTDWKDNATLFAATAATSPHSAKAQYNYGTVLQDRGDLDEAVFQFRRALEIYPQYRQAAFAIGKAYELKNIPAGALYWYAKAIDIDWQTTKAHLQTGLIRQQLGEFAAAEAAFRTGLGQEPNNPFLLLALGAARAEQGDPWEAFQLARAYDDLIWTRPRYREQYAELRHQLGRALNL